MSKESTKALFFNREGNTPGTAWEAEPMHKLIDQIYDNNLIGKNILDNSNFKNPVNQRGFTSTSQGSKYTIDRWVTWTGGVSMSSAGLHLNAGKTLCQYIEDNLATSFGTCIGSLGIVTGTARIEFVQEEPNRAMIVITAVSNCILSWAKLEKGTEATAYQIPNYSDEFNKCLRFFQRIGDKHSESLVSMGYIPTGNKWGSGVIQYHPKRAIPNIRFDTSNNYRALILTPTGFTALGLFNFYMHTRSKDSMLVIADWGTTSNPVGYYTIQRNDGISTGAAWIDVDAEIIQV